MSENIMAAYELAGFCFLTVCTLVGAWVVLRWGWVGIMLLWQKGPEFDAVTEAEALERWKHRED